MNFVIDNFYLIFALVIAVIIGVVVIVRFLTLPSEAQLQMVREWLLYACLEAERELGEKTGQAKLAKVYDVFVTKFTWIAKIISFDMFADMVREAVIEMTHLLETNPQLAKYVKGE